MLWETWVFHFPDQDLKMLLKHLLALAVEAWIKLLSYKELILPSEWVLQIIEVSSDDWWCHYADVILLSSRSWPGIWFVTRTRVGFWAWIWPLRYCRLNQKVACWFQCLKNSTCYVDQSHNSGAVDVKMACSWRKIRLEDVSTAFLL